MGSIIDVLSKKIILGINRLATHKEYLFMQDRARTHTAKLTLKMLNKKKQL